MLVWVEQQQIALHQAVGRMTWQDFGPEAELADALPSGPELIEWDLRLYQEVAELALPLVHLVLLEVYASIRE